MASHFNLPKEHGSLEIVDNLNAIQLLSTNELIASKDIKNKTFYKLLLEFIKEASLRLSDVIIAITKAKRYHEGDDSVVRYFPLGQQFLLYEILALEMETLRSGSSANAPRVLSSLFLTRENNTMSPCIPSAVVVVVTLIL
jgi:hypothetical protein